jgi:hypothetical protein
MVMPNFSSPTSTQTDLDKFLTFFQGKFKIFLETIKNCPNLKKVHASEINISIFHMWKVKILTTSRVKLKKLILIRHLGSIQHFWLIWKIRSSGLVAGQNMNSLQKIECKNSAKFQSYLHLIFGCHLGH